MTPSSAHLKLIDRAEVRLGQSLVHLLTDAGTPQTDVIGTLSNRRFHVIPECNKRDAEARDEEIDQVIEGFLRDES